LRKWLLKIIFIVVFTNTCFAQTYKYDAANRLVQISSNCSGTVYVYDANGNRTSISQISIVTTSSVTDEHCGNDGQITITPQGAVTYRYLWSNGQTTASVKNLSGGNYSVVITEPTTGFTCNQSFTVNPAFKDSLQVVPQTPVCIDGTNGKAKIKVITPNPKGTYSYHWSTSTDTSYLKLDSIGSLKPGNYSVNVRNSYTGCVKTIAFKIGQPSSFVTGITQTPPKCPHGSDATAKAEVTGNPAQYTFSWTGGTIGTKTTQLITAITAGTYTVIVTQIATGCIITQSVTIADKPPLFTIVKTDSKCFQSNDGTASVQPTSGTVSDYSYAWTGPFTGFLRTAQITNLVPGIYHVLVTENAGNRCTDTASVTIAEPPSIIQDVTVSQIICKGQNDGSATAKVSGVTTQYTYRWYYQTGGYFVNQTGAIVNNLKPGVYTLSVTSPTGCVSSKTFTIQESAFAGSGLLFPNPTTGAVTVEICNIVNQQIDFYVYTDAGQLVKNGTALGSNGKVSFDISRLAPGVYAVTLVISGQKYSFAVIKK